MSTNNNSFTHLWRITRIVALVLLIATFYLANKSRSQENSGYIGYITNASSTAYLRRGPDIDSQIISILDDETTVHVNNSLVENSITWLYIETENQSGWILENNLVKP